MVAFASLVMSEQDLSLADSMFRSIKPVKAKTERKTTSVGEERCRAFLESHFNTRFPKVRPSFLTNPITGSPLELDGYNEKLQIAFEYNGRQHYEFEPHFHKSKADFYNGQYRDELKRNLCRKKGVRLLVVSYKHEDIEKELLRQIKLIL
jgi:hypothetical protein